MAIEKIDDTVAKRSAEYVPLSHIISCAFTLLYVPKPAYDFWPAILRYVPKNIAKMFSLLDMSCQTQFIKELKVIDNICDLKPLKSHQNHFDITLTFIHYISADTPAF